MLTSKEIDTLIDALEAWEKKDNESKLMFGLMGAMLIPKDAPPEVREKFERDDAERNRKLDEEARQRKDLSLLLKAKLVTMKQEMATNTANILK